MATFEKPGEKELEAFTIKEYNRYEILKTIRRDGPQRFKDLQEKSGHSPRGLSNMLKDLLDAKRIEKTIHKEHQAYKVTNMGDKALLNLEIIFGYRKKIMLDGGRYYDRYSNQWGSMLFCGLPWGIDDDLMLDKNITPEMNPITKETVIEVQKFLFKKLLSDIKRKKISFDETKNGTILLEFSIEYKELVKSLEMNSLKIYENVIKEELDLYQKVEDNSLQKWERNLLNEVREEKITKEQFRRKLKRLQKQQEKKKKEKK